MTYPPGPANSGYTPLPPTPDTSGHFRLADMAPSPRRRKLWPMVAAFVAVVVIGVGALGWWLLRPHAPAAGETGLTIAAAHGDCEEAVKAKLKAPATAKFGGREESTTKTDIPVRVSGWVDSENSFGALIRNRYSCLATPTEHGWSVGDVTFSDW